MKDNSKHDLKDEIPRDLEVQPVDREAAIDLLRRMKGKAIAAAAEATKKTSLPSRDRESDDERERTEKRMAELKQQAAELEKGED